MKKWYLVAALALLMTGCGDSDTVEPTDTSRYITDSYGTEEEYSEREEEGEEDSDTSFREVEYDGTTYIEASWAGVTSEEIDYVYVEGAVVGVVGSGEESYMLVAMGSDIGTLVRSFPLSSSDIDVNVDELVEVGDYVAIYGISRNFGFIDDEPLYEIDGRWCPAADVSFHYCEVIGEAGGIKTDLYEEYWTIPASEVYETYKEVSEMYRNDMRPSVVMEGEDYWDTQRNYALVEGTLVGQFGGDRNDFTLVTDDGVEFPIMTSAAYWMHGPGDRILAFVNLLSYDWNSSEYLGILAYKVLEEAGNDRRFIEHYDSFEQMDMFYEAFTTLDASALYEFYTDGLVIKTDDEGFFLAIGGDLGTTIYCYSYELDQDAPEVGDHIRVFAYRSIVPGDILEYDGKYVGTASSVALSYEYLDGELELSFDKYEEYWNKTTEEVYGVAYPISEYGFSIDSYRYLDENHGIVKGVVTSVYEPSTTREGFQLVLDCDGYTFIPHFEEHLWDDYEAGDTVVVAIQYDGCGVRYADIYVYEDVIKDNPDVVVPEGYGIIKLD